jgi:dCMP deaminase
MTIPKGNVCLHYPVIFCFSIRDVVKWADFRSKQEKGSNSRIFVYFMTMHRPTFDEIYMGLARNLANKSHCVKIKVGAVLTKDTRIVSLGYNGPPAGTHNCDQEWPETGCPRDSKGSCSLALHAEQNAILYASKNGVPMDGSTLYVTLSPCLACARIIFTMGIKKVLYLESYASYKGIQSDEGVDFLRRFGVEVIHYQLPATV